MYTYIHAYNIHVKMLHAYTCTYIYTYTRIHMEGAAGLAVPTSFGAFGFLALILDSGGGWLEALS